MTTEATHLPFDGVNRLGSGRELGPPGIDELVNKRLPYAKSKVRYR